MGLTLDWMGRQLARYLSAPGDGQGRLNALVEADVVEGVRALPLAEYARFATRICRPVGLSSAQIAKVLEHAIARIGHRYDLKNVFDLARYLFPAPPVPARLRRRLIALGSGSDPGIKPAHSGAFDFTALAWPKSGDYLRAWAS